MNINTLQQKNIICNWIGRHDNVVQVIGATTIEDAREHAIAFAECPEGIVLDEGTLKTWPYDEPQPDDWQDYYYFRMEDEHPVDYREWWEE